MPRWILRAGIALAVGLLAEQSQTMAPPAAVDIDQQLVCRFDSATLGEVSGMAVSRRHPNVVWMTNDSGGGPLLFAVNMRTCRIKTTLKLLDTPARDHEALASGVDAQGQDVLWIGDIGDNRASWPYVRIHKVIEPEQLPSGATLNVPVTTYRYTYPGGPADAEALLAAPDREQLWVVTKEAGVGEILALPTPLRATQTPMRAKHVGTARSFITDGAVSPDGKRFVLRDYLSAEVFSGDPPGRAQARFRLPLSPQGESIAWTADGESLLIASEKSPDLIRVSVPRTALGTDPGVASALPRVAGFDIYPYVRLAAMSLAVLVGYGWLRRRMRKHRRRKVARG